MTQSFHTPASLFIRRAVLVLALVLLVGVQASRAAVSASTAFQQLTSSFSGPGGYNTGSRNIMVAGSLHVWTPSTDVQLISLTPPSLNAGCGGISMYFGGFSFINGAQFQQLVTDVMQNAQGYVMELAIRTLCPMCADILDAMQKLAQMANSLGANSCKVAEDLVNKAAGLASIGPDAPNGKSEATASQGSCSSTAQNSGVVSDYDQAMSGICSSVQQATSWISNELNSLSAAMQPQAASNVAAIHGNTEWALLTQSGYADTSIKDLVLSMTGFSVKPFTGQDTTVLYGATLTPQAYMKALLYGVNPSATAKLMATNSQYASGALNDLVTDYEVMGRNGHYLKDYVYLCGRTANGNSALAPAWTPYGTVAGVTYPTGMNWSNACNGPFDAISSGQTAYSGPAPAMVEISQLYGNSQFNLLGEHGLLYDVGTSLAAAVQAVSQNKPIPSSALALMQLTPLPVYQMINLAAVYPGVAGRLVNSYSELIALQIARSVTERGLSDTSTALLGATGSPGPGAFHALQKVMRRLQAQMNALTQTMDREVYLEEGMFLNIQQIQRVIADQATENGLAGGMLFTRGLAASVAEGH